MLDTALSNLVRPEARVATFSKGIAEAPHVRALLGCGEMLLGPTDATGIDYVVGWGRKANTARAQLFAARHDLPYVRLEDGFVRSVGLGVHGSPAYSIVLDDLGIYYDGTRTSRLEALLQDLETPFPRPIVEQAERAIAFCVEHELSKYNDSPAELPPLPESAGRARVLVVDQTAGDLSLQYSGMTDAALMHMIEAARKENPGAQLLIKSHPDVLSGKRRSALAEAGVTQGAELLTTPCNPIALLSNVDRVYVGSSQLGFEALMCGKSVTCFGLPFYAGWGLTDDRVPCTRRTTRRTLAEVFAAAYLMYARYLNPETLARGELEDVLEHMARQRAMFRRNRQDFRCYGFSSWKHAFVRAYLRAPGNGITFADRTKLGERKVDPATTPVVWGTKHPRSLDAGLRRSGRSPLRMEDGFLRSPGLGSDLTIPASLVLDSRGIYYDPTGPSDLEALLETTEFGAEELSRARALRALILKTGISKYNLGQDQAPLAAGRKQGQPVVLVPGQVETDASIRLGCRDVRDNLALLRAVRDCRPDAFLVYKPHPDVLSGNRRGVLHRSAAMEFCDEVVLDIHISACLAAADEVHTMTSLVGFEALMRELPVHVYGQPFYAGWGLTHDRHPCPRRTRRLTLDMLVAGALLRYPRYVHPETLEFITPEGVVAYLKAVGRGSLGARESWARRQAKRFARSLRGVAGVR